MKLFPLKNPRHHFGYFLADKKLRAKASKFQHLSDEEKKLLQDTWPGLEFYQIDLMWNRIHKHFRSFSPYYLGAAQSDIVRGLLNPYDQLVSLENKAMCDVWFPEIPFPEVLVRSFDGVLYDKHMNAISEKDAVQIISCENEVIFKPSVGTMCGIGVRKVNVEKLKEAGSLQYNRSNYFIVQKVLRQEELIARLNPSSINCCRITSLYINGKFDFSAMIKVGMQGSFVDNWRCSYLIGMSKDGKLDNIGFDKQLNIVRTTDNGINFGGMSVPGFGKMVELVEKLHKKYFPFCGIIGWDIIINSDNNPIVIEANLATPGLVGEQLVSGPFLEPFVGDICDKLKKRNL